MSGRRHAMDDGQDRLSKVRELFVSAAESGQATKAKPADRRGRQAELESKVSGTTREPAVGRILSGSDHESCGMILINSVQTPGQKGTASRLRRFYYEVVKAKDSSTTIGFL